jgi:cullin 3
MFRRGLKGMSSDVEIDASLEQVVTVFRFLQDKDVFESFYKQHLAKRLLTGRNVSDEAERGMISKLKNECGHQYTSKLEGMFQDMKLSEDLTKQYQASFPATRGHGVELRVSVLTSGFWPGSPGAPCELPAEIQQCCASFETFYLAKHTGRRLTWQPSHGFADVKAVMPKSRHELNVSTYQMCILMLFNNHPVLSYRDLHSRTNIPLEELKRQLMSLYVNPKAKILIKSGGDKEKTKEPLDTDTFQVNPAFECKFFRIKVPLVQMKTGPGGADGVTKADGSDAAAKGQDELPAVVEEERKHLVEAVIVRVMKSRKTLEHNQLVMEVTRHLTSRFLPSPTLIKQRIEKLIEREYLERSQHDRRVYNYLA